MLPVVGFDRRGVMEEATANSFIEEHLPKITFFREAYEAQASALNVPMEGRVLAA